jgi:hypothetical protein
MKFQFLASLIALQGNELYWLPYKHLQLLNKEIQKKCATPSSVVSLLVGAGSNGCLI